MRVHALIQRAVRETLTPDLFERTARSAADALTAAWPEVERDTTLCQALRTCTTTLITWAGPDLHRPHAHGVLSRSGRSLGETGQVTAAITYHRHLVETTTEHLGPRHPHALDARHSLAYWRRQTGDAAAPSSQDG